MAECSSRSRWLSRRESGGSGSEANEATRISNLQISAAWHVALLRIANLVIALPKVKPGLRAALPA